ncbi:hypothetical protein GCM10023215_43700 [Pseudonocardia yuanmonensis]|uniref:Uncharacterized protein n=1 Tax=Pseudonocardia yuanmonensis TaxID=1095914 RepID=A0ABP8X3V3_9PSEU
MAPVGPAHTGDGLEGRTAIVTGAGSQTSGIGNGGAAAVLLARAGARVVLVDAVAAGSTRRWTWSRRSAGSPWR